MDTPNQGKKIVDKFSDNRWMQLLDPITIALGSDSLPNLLEGMAEFVVIRSGHLMMR